MKFTEKELLEDNIEFLDRIALETMKVYLEKKQPTGFPDSLSIARVSYKQALAMLDVKKELLLKLAEEQKMLKKD